MLAIQFVVVVLPDPSRGKGAQMEPRRDSEVERTSRSVPEIKDLTEKKSQR